ncbi:hypothetical protein [Pseudomonas sp. CGJS7]|uniref:hypothetical protein n=1 Tax=Pseudomonas sp. CGJS7 TaxID=3109348 RepID=UPI003009B606
MNNATYQQQQKRLTNFAKELEQLSRKHGVIVRSIGGVWVAEDIAECKNVYYDIASDGDLMPESPDWDDLPSTVPQQPDDAPQCGAFFVPLR